MQAQHLFDCLPAVVSFYKAEKADKNLPTTTGIDEKFGLVLRIVLWNIYT